MAAEIDVHYKWQPVVLIAPRRLDCDRCGAACIFLELDECAEGPGTDNFHTTAYCQACYEAEYEEGD